MMLQELPKFLVEHNAKLLVKYDGERSIKKYTIRLLFSDEKLNSIGNDTDSPCSLLSDIFEGNGLFDIEEMLNFYNNIINTGIESLKDKLGKDCVISVLFEERSGNIMYMLHVQMAKETRHLFGNNYIELCKAII